MRARGLERGAALVAGLVVLVAAGCAPRLRYEPDELRAYVAPRLHTIAAEELVVPFEVGPAERERARSSVAQAPTELERAAMLRDALFDEDAFGIRYSLVATCTAREAVERREGNCLAIASTFVGLARSVGLAAYYLDASARENEVHEAGDVVVNVGHITAVVDTDVGDFALDFGWGLDTDQRYRRIGDVEATAHYYNNAGFDEIEGALARHEPVDWPAAARHFTIATEVLPTFARAWNNLGIARARLGDLDGAEQAYVEAIAHDGALVAPRANLGGVLLARGEVDAALAAWDEAIDLDPRNARLLWHRSVALARRGDRAGALEALDRALAVDPNLVAARELRERLLAGEDVAP